MNYEKDCETCIHNGKTALENPCMACTCSYDGTPTLWEAGANYRSMTNYERIKAMSVEEMADLLDEITESCSDIGGGYHCNKCPIGKFNKYRCDTRGWLESECDT